MKPKERAPDFIFRVSIKPYRYRTQGRLRSGWVVRTSPPVRRKWFQSRARALVCARQLLSDAWKALP